MLRASIDAFLALRRAAGFKLRTEGQLLHNFAQWASDRGETYVRTTMATEWAAMAHSSWQRERRLRVVAGFARHARAEDPRHETPPIFIFGRRHVRPHPYIYSSGELQSLLNAASRLAPTGSQTLQSTAFLSARQSSTRVGSCLFIQLQIQRSDGFLRSAGAAASRAITSSSHPMEIGLPTARRIRRSVVW